MNEFEDETLILSVESSTRGGSLAVLKNSKVCAEWRGADNFSLSGGLLFEIQSILRKTGVNLSEINLLAATIGPGSFTDLRIGLAVIKGLAAVWDIPIVGVPTLEATTFDCSKKETIIAFLPAGRDEVFAQIFRSGVNEISAPLICGKLEQILFELKSENALSLIASLNLHQNINAFIKAEKKDKWIVSPPPNNLAAATGKLAFKRFRQHNLNGNSWQIIYGREAVAARNKKA